jgi:hypothetical protein
MNNNVPEHSINQPRIFFLIHERNRMRKVDMVEGSEYQGAWVNDEKEEYYRP